MKKIIASIILVFIPMFIVLTLVLGSFNPNASLISSAFLSFALSVFYISLFIEIGILKDQIKEETEHQREVNVQLLKNLAK